MSTTYVASLPIRTERVLQSAESHGFALAAIHATVDEQEVPAERAITEHSAWADTGWPGRLSGSDSAERYRAVCRRGMAREVSAVLNLDRRRERIEPAFVDTPGHQCADPDRIGANVTDTHASSARKPTTSPGSIATGMSLSATDHVYQRCPPSAEGHEVGATDQVGTRAVTPAASRTRPPWRLHPCRARRTGPLYPGPSPSRDPAEPGCRLFGPRSL